MNYTPSPEAIEAAEDALWDALPWPAGKSAKVPLDMMHDPAVAALIAAMPIELAKAQKDAWQAGVNAVYAMWEKWNEPTSVERMYWPDVVNPFDALPSDDWDTRHDTICHRSGFCSAHRPGYALPGEEGQSMSDEPEIWYDVPDDTPYPESEVGAEEL